MSLCAFDVPVGQRFCMRVPGICVNVTGCLHPTPTDFEDDILLWEEAGVFFRNFHVNVFEVKNR